MYSNAPDRRLFLAYNPLHVSLDIDRCQPDSGDDSATISASCAFMLPVATAPNVIVFRAGGIRTDQMARNGLLLNLYAAVVITIVVLIVGV
jgi:hypothetical protein